MFDKEITLKRKEFINQGLLKPNPAKEDIAEVVHEELQQYQVNNAEEIECLKGLTVNSDETPGDFTKNGNLGSNFDSLFDLAFDSLVKSKKVRIVEPMFQICPERDTLTWTYMIIDLAQHGMGNEAI
ncbi:unnamed protein product [Vicia faba]|uniref:Uncharacterized protein n=1 Tax=Vicia faba TaxID=3906 RepID=A0AAV0ZBU6_VICFA|nr:unnamed protein product [Vicia faba]